jgi:hypothetical protein
MRKTAKLLRLYATASVIALTVTVNAQDAATANDVDTNSVNADSVGTTNINPDNSVNVSNVNADNIDTANVSANNVNTDTVTVDISKVKVDTANIAVTSPPDINRNADDTQPLSGACFGIGLGLSVGTAPIFPMWQKSFPDSLRKLGLSPTSGADENGNDTALLRYRVTESPDAFNFALPFCLSLYSIGEKHVFAFTVSFFQNNKEFQAEISINSDRRLSVLERLTYYSVFMEATAQWAIPAAFFSIDGTQQTLLSLTLGASPVNTFTRKCDIITSFNKDNDARMKNVIDSVKNAFAAQTGNGLSLSWRIGISSIKRYPSGYGAEFGLFYSGSYSGYFYSNGVRLTEEHVKTRGMDINAESVTGGKPLSFLSNQAEFRATLLVPTKKRKVAGD